MKIGSQSMEITTHFSEAVVESNLKVATRTRQMEGLGLSLELNCLPAEHVLNTWPSHGTVGTSERWGLVGEGSWVTGAMTPKGVVFDVRRHRDQVVSLESTSLGPCLQFWRVSS